MRGEYSKEYSEKQMYGKIPRSRHMSRWNDEERRVLERRSEREVWISRKEWDSTGDIIL